MITIKAGWEPHSIRRGIQIYRRRARTGTCGGCWMIPGSTFTTLSAARRYIDELPEDHYCGPGQTMADTEKGK